MNITTIEIHLELTDVFSLKGRRAVTNSLKDKLKKLNISVLDISGSYSKEADIAIVFLAPNPLEASKIRQTIENILERNFSQYYFELDIDEQ